MNISNKTLKLLNKSLNKIDNINLNIKQNASDIQLLNRYTEHYPVMYTNINDIIKKEF